MDKIKYHIPQFVLGILFWILIVIAFFYLYGTIDKIDKIYSILDTEKVNTKIEVECP